MNELKFSKSEVVGFLESMIMNEEATQDETELYIDYTWTGKLVKGYTYKKLVKKMKRIYNGF